MISLSNRKHLHYLALIFILIAAVVTVFYIIKYPVENSFGERFVKDQIPLFFPFYLILSVKPLTLIIFCLSISYILLLEDEKIITKLSKPLTRIILALGASISIYELIWNYFAWFSVWIKENGNLDLLPNKTHAFYLIPVNFNFATKFFFLISFCCLYGLWRLKK
jgi:hypothetical protein